MNVDASNPRSVPRNPVPGPHNCQVDTGSPALPCLLDRPGALLTSSGRAAILLGLESLALSPDQRVLVPSYHCPTMVSPVLTLGHRLGFYPIAADGRPSLDWLEQHAPADTRVLCVAHFFGLPLDLRDLRAWCQRRGVLMLEDCAHAMFGQGEGGAVGALGDVVIASLPKFFAAQNGGLLLVKQPARPVAPLEPVGLKGQLKATLDDLEISACYGQLGLRRVWAAPLLALKRMLRGGGRATPTSAAPQPARFDPAGDYARIDVKLCHRAPTRAATRAALLTSRGRVIARRQQHYRAMATALANRPGMRPLFPALAEHSAPYVFPLWVDDPDPAYQALRALGVPVSRWDWLWPGVPDLAGDQGKIWSHHVLQLHCHQDMSDQDRNWVIDALLTYRRS
ncbi:DegT/DnrJ/EryC1/StrS family aminotransferase [Roseateles saccharophilus]|uniref:dTDP-4-amino-4,6-dideoxygalactose transaminase n=1 Tax=Roseateles saccharophilus TaxID=304 RepID=A0A4R3UHY4_ROSSA|nr:DegT/DnrJ/EryC1/StrS family aminotransferase [Roseateles saccharophilus]MDG0835170.1 DegT/DnrJ/EryC1/StrS aminotransferase family protein [Roseateles saccharophilus]TCU87811.1 dTDP-4-amino-4,6-dideoxygalactose transaminase [Roseateles saccharophilus]